MAALPRAHSMSRDFGFSGLGFSFRTKPPSTTAMAEHLFGHSSQVVGISFVSAAELRPFLKYLRHPTCVAATAPAVAPALFRNSRRSMRIVPIVVSLVIEEGPEGRPPGPGHSGF